MISGKNILKKFALSTFYTKDVCKNFKRLSSMYSVKSNYDAYVSICIERHPVITHSVSELQQNFCGMLHELENENSIKSNYQLQKEKELNQLSSSKDTRLKLDFSSFSKQSIQDFDEFRQKELKNLIIAPKLTDANINISSSERKLNNSLFLVRKQEMDDVKEIWLPPKHIIYEGETIKQIAKRILSNCGDDFNVFLYGNTPITFHEYGCKDYKKSSNEIRGCKVFHLLAKYVSGDLRSSTRYKWLSIDELQTVLSEPIYKHMFHFYLRTK